MQTNIKITGNAITGTLKYVTGYTGFSGDPAEQEGNYIALHFETNDPRATITVEVINGTVGHPITLDDDGLCIFRIADKDTQSIRVVATYGDDVVTTTYDLTGLTLNNS